MIIKRNLANLDSSNCEETLQFVPITPDIIAVTYEMEIGKAYQ